MKNWILVFALLGFSLTAFSQTNISREKLIGNIIKSSLETYHYRKMRIDDSVSQKAFKEFLKKMDYGKQFFLKSDIAKLEKFQFQMDDEMESGNYKLLDQAVKIMTKRIKEADGYRKSIFKKPFNFKSHEKIENDPEKKTWVSTKKELKRRWRENFKQAVLGRYMSMLEAEKSEKENAKKKTKEEKSKKSSKTKEKKKVAKAEKPLTDKEKRKKAHDSVNKKYTNFFARMLKEDRTDYLEKFYNSVSTIFDPHTNYLPPKRKEDFDIDISGQLEGIGAVLQEDGNYIKVVKIVPGGAAWRQKGLEVDDVILLVGQADKDPVDLVGMRVDDAVRYIRGPKGSEVRLTVKKADGSRKTIPIIRDVVQIGASYAKSSVLEHKKLGIKIGYILVPKFYRDFDKRAKNCTDDVRKELERLKKANVDGVILDLRNNGGGALEDARQMSGLFINEGPIVQIKSHTGQIDVLSDNDGQTTYDGPLVVMVNRFSASASEILAAAMKDYKRAVIVGGEFTHGKGTVQAVLPLNQGPLKSLFGPSMGALKVTIQKFYRINGLSTQYKGVTPDITLPDPIAYSENREQDLDYSLPWDSVAPQKYKEWNKFHFDIDKLKARSAERIKMDNRFSKIKKSVDYLIKRRNDTKITLNLKSLQKEEEKSKKRFKEFKIEKKSENIVVTNYEASLKDQEKIQPGDEEHWKEEFDKRKEEWVSSLMLDPLLEETLFIMDDMVRTTKGKKLTMVHTK